MGKSVVESGTLVLKSFHLIKTLFAHDLFMSITITFGSSSMPSDAATCTVTLPDWLLGFAAGADLNRSCARSCLT